MPELSYRASLILSRASLLLADVTCVQGTPSSSTTPTTSTHSVQTFKYSVAVGVSAPQGVAEEMTCVFDGLAKSITKQVWLWCVHVARIHIALSFPSLITAVWVYVIANYFLWVELATNISYEVYEIE